MTQERSAYRPPISEAQAHIQHWMRQDTRPTGILNDLEVLKQRSIAREGVGAQVDAGSRKRHAATPPTDADVEAHDGGAEPKLWARIDAAWRCPGCDRDRKGLVRRSKKPGRRWTGGVRAHNEYILQDVGTPEGAYLEDMALRHDRVLICEDCNNIGPQLRARDPTLSGVSWVLQLDDIRAAVTATPHQPHVVDWDVLRKRIRDGAPRLPPIQAYDRYLAEAIGARRSRQYFLSLTPDDPGLAWRRLVERRKLSNETIEEVSEYLAFLIAEADRLDPDSSI